MFRKTLPLLLLCYLISACARVTPTAGVPTRKATPLEQVLAYNDSLAQANKALAQVVINATATTPPLLTVEQANIILIKESRIADFDRQLTPLLVSAGNVTANAKSIEMLLDEIKRLANPLTATDIGIQNAETQQKVLSAFKNIYTFADLIVNALQQAGLLKACVGGQEFWNPEWQMCSNVPYCPGAGCAPVAIHYDEKPLGISYAEKSLGLKP